jgi:hypothetical protein
LSKAENGEETEKEETGESKGVPNVGSVLTAIGGH